MLSRHFPSGPVAGLCLDLVSGGESSGGGGFECRAQILGFQNYVKWEILTCPSDLSRILENV